MRHTRMAHESYRNEMNSVVIVWLLYGYCMVRQGRSWGIAEEEEKAPGSIGAIIYGYII
jgi:hypothetical protein